MNQISTMDCGNTEDNNNNEWVQYVIDNAVNYLEDIIFNTEGE